MSEFGKVFTRNDMLRHHFSKHKFLRDIKKFKVGELVEIFLDADLILYSFLIVTLLSGMRPSKGKKVPVMNVTDWFMNRHHESNHREKARCKCSTQGKKVLG